MYRSATVRLCFHALDRPDLQGEWRDGRRHQQLETCKHSEVARYSTGHGRLIQEFVRQVEESQIVVFTDSDHANCLTSR